MTVGINIAYPEKQRRYFIRKVWFADYFFDFLWYVITIFFSPSSSIFKI